MDTFINKVRALAMARELCDTPEDEKKFVSLALTLERKLGEKDLDEEHATKVARLIREKNRAMAAELDRIAQSINIRKLVRAIGQQQQNDLYNMAIITILMIWLEPPTNKPQRSF